MKKDIIRTIIAEAIVLIIFHLIVFMIPFNRDNAVFWISYGFSLAAYAVLLDAVYIAFYKSPNAKSRFYGFPIARLALYYGGVQFVACILFMLLGKWTPWWVAVLVYAIGLAAALLGLIGADVAAEHVEKVEQKTKVNTSVMKSLVAKVDVMAATCENQEAAVALRAMAEELKYSDPVSVAATAALEMEMGVLVGQLQSAAATGDDLGVKRICRRLSAMLSERNAVCRQNKY